MEAVLAATSAGVPRATTSPPCAPAPGPISRDIVGLLHGFFVVFHHQKRVAQIPQPLQRVKKHGVVPLVQANAGLVQGYRAPHQPAADLGCQADALGLAARKRPR